jgi:hypothetical protein
MNKPIPAGVGAPAEENLDRNPSAKCRAGESDCAQKAQPARGLPRVVSRKTATKMRVAMTTLLQLCIVGIWLYGACRLFRQAHPVLAGALLLVIPCQVCARLRARRQRRIALPLGYARLPRQSDKLAPQHSIRHTLLENGFNERVSVMIPPTGHVFRHAERADKNGSTQGR